MEAVVFLFLLFEEDIYSMNKTYNYITSSNGFSAVVFSDLTRRVEMFYPHIYKNYDKNTVVNNIAYDTYFGVSVDNNSYWLPERVEGYERCGYIDGTGIINTKRIIGNLEVEEFFYAPMSLEFSGMIMLIKIRTLSDVSNLSVFSLHNFHLGLEGGSTNNLMERIKYHPSDIFIETSSSSRYAVGFKPLLAGTIHSTNPLNPYNIVKAGGRLSNVDDSGPIDDAVCGFEKYFGDMPAHQERWFGVLILYTDDKMKQDDMSLRALEYLSNYSPEELLNLEIDFWNKYFLKLDKGFIEMASIDPLMKAAAVFLKMGQVREKNDITRSPYGQILASLPPGMWNISWLRDMMYSVYALISIGAEKEAYEALNFVLNARTGDYKEYVGTDYQFSVCRYFGDGSEESDTNEDGPNIEYDGAGLFLIGVDMFIKRFGVERIVDRIPIILDGFADVLLYLLDEKGLIRKDSSIWERHLNGNERHFTYTQITAAAGLCAASSIAKDGGMIEDSARYLNGYNVIVSNIYQKLVHPDGFLVSSLEEFAQKSGYLDASVIDGINFGIIKGDSDEALNTLYTLSSLKTVGGGYKRNDDGEWYDKQEWVFIDLRIAEAFKRVGDNRNHLSLIKRVSQYTNQNNSQFPELITEDGRSVTGSIPMIGFGAGAYILAAMSPDYLDCDIEIVDAGGVIRDADEDSGSEDLATDMVNESVQDVALITDLAITMEADSSDSRTDSHSCSCNIVEW